MTEARTTIVLELNPYGLSLMFYTSREDYLIDTRGMSGCTMWKEKVCHLGVFDAELDTLVHEIFHVVVYVMEYIAQVLDSHTDEPAAYLAGWLFKNLQPHLSLEIV